MVELVFFNILVLDVVLGLFLVGSELAPKKAETQPLFRFGSELVPSSEFGFFWSDGIWTKILGLGSE